MKTTAKKKKAKDFEGHVYVCQHRVWFRYELDDHELTEELERRLKAEAEERAKEMICENYYAGELNCLSPDDGCESEEIFGWWGIDR